MAGSEDLASLLARIPLAEWESPGRFQSLDLCLRETMRLVANGTLPRRNVGEEITVDGHTIRHDEFVLLMTENLHFDESVYDEPMRFMPDRDLTVAEARGSFVGWGRGMLLVSSRNAFTFTKHEQVYTRVPANDMPDYSYER